LKIKLHKMHQRVLTIKLPNTVKIGDKEAKMIFASRLYEEGLISSGEAAEIVGITRREFIETMGKYGGSVFQQDTEELESDMRNA
jgi:predicted HTH domain antitoxin